MFFIPIGILLHADVCGVLLNRYMDLMYLPQLTVAEYIRKSFIAAYLGNIIGALFVAGPAIYFYLSDYSADKLRGVEEGEVLNEKPALNGLGNGSSSSTARRSD